MRAAVVASDPAASRLPADAPVARFTVSFSRNSFGWAGTGTLEILPDGLRLAARREGLLSYARARESLHLPFSRITSVLREADVVRLQFRRISSASTELVEFSAGSSAAATTIVAHLPTALAVELDHAATPAPPRRRPIDVRYLLAGLLVAGAIAVVQMLRDSPVPAPAPALQTTRPSQTAAQPVPMPAEDLEALRDELRAAQARTAQMRAHFALELEALMDGEISQSDFALTLERALIPQWGYEGTERSRRAGNAGTRARALELMSLSAGSWSLGLTTYARGLRSADPKTVRQAFDSMSDAEEFERQAYALLWDAQERASR